MSENEDRKSHAGDRYQVPPISRENAPVVRVFGSCPSLRIAAKMPEKYKKTKGLLSPKRIVVLKVEWQE